jgi:hypothetical protein
LGPAKESQNVTSLIYLRDHEEGDFEDVLEMSRDPLVQTYLGGIKPLQETRDGFELRKTDHELHPKKSV